MATPAQTLGAPETKAPSKIETLLARKTAVVKTRLKTLHDCGVSQDEETGDILIRVPQRILASAVFDSRPNEKTGKVSSMVTLMPKQSNGTPGSVRVPVVIADGEDEAVFEMRIGCINAFIS